MEYLKLLGHNESFAQFKLIFDVFSKCMMNTVDRRSIFQLIGSTIKMKKIIYKFVKMVFICRIFNARKKNIWKIIKHIYLL